MSVLICCSLSLFILIFLEQVQFFIMASKNHVDSSVAERRLRPIYNWLDDGNNKKALQEAEKVLKKQPNFQCAKVLKALALLRLGKEIECQQLLESIRKDLQCDDSTLSAMTICYREMNKPEVICDVYSEATKKDPKNEELLTHLFMAYVRVCDYKKQQQTAMALYKLKFKNHYYFWTVMSIVMQAHEAGPELAKNLQLPLAEKMVTKFVEDGKIEAEQEVQLYLMILEMQNKLEEALAVVEGPLGEMLHSYIVVPTKRVELMVKMECWKQANIEIKKILIDDMDNWSLYLNYFKTVFKIVDLESSGNGVIEDDSSDKTINDSVKFLTDIQAKNQSGSHHLRGPYLAIMEFFIQLQDKGKDPEMYFGYFTDLLLVYFSNFGSKTCCLNDLKPYLNKLSESQVKTFLDEVWKFIELEDGQLPTSKEQMLRYISNLQITRYLGFHEKLNIKAKLQLVDCLLRYYIHGAQFNGSSLLPTDIRHNDPFVILIVEMLNDIWLETYDSCYLKNAIVILEHALEKSPSNHQFKLLLIKLYNTLGITAASQKIYDLLDVKHVQLDSMGYLQCWPLISTGQYFFGLTFM
uniref:N-terminal acetyltransferase B complex subunit MDM20 homolog n=1 Tax=Homalodisca liturata TaxID=320908 RepID=A0A1B6HRG4_9HEMI